METASGIPRPMQPLGRGCFCPHARFFLGACVRGSASLHSPRAAYFSSCFGPLGSKRSLVTDQRLSLPPAVDPRGVANALPYRSVTMCHRRGCFGFVHTPGEPSRVCCYTSYVRTQDVRPSGLNGIGSETPDVESPNTPPAYRCYVACIWRTSPILYQLRWEMMFRDED